MSKKKFFSWLNPINWFGKSKKVSDENQSQTEVGDTGDTGAGQTENGNPEPVSADATPAVMESRPKEEEAYTLGKLYAEMMSYSSDPKLTEEQMFLRMKEDWKRMSAAMDCLRRISNHYGSGEDDPKIEQKLEELFGSTSNADFGDEAKKAVYGKIIETLKAKWDDNPILKELLRKAEEQCNFKTNESIFEKLVQLAPTMLKRDSNSPISGGSVEVDQELLDKNATTVIGWLVSKLKSYTDNELSRIDPNSPEEAIRNIASRFKDNDEDVVKILLSEDVEVEKYADLFKPWLVRKINKLLRNESDYIDVTSLFDAIVHRIVTAIEDAKKYEQLKNEQKSGAGTTPYPVVGNKLQQPVETGSESHNDQEVEKLLKDYEAQSVKDLSDKINARLGAANAEKNAHKNEAVKANKKVSEVVKELQSRIKADSAEEQAGSQTSEDKEANPVELLKVYTDQTESEKAALAKEKTELSDRCKELEKKNAALSDDKSALEGTLKDKEAVLEGEASALIDALQTGVNKVDGELEMPLVTPCNSDTDDFSSQSDEIEERLKSSLKQCLENLKAVKPEEGAAPDDVRKQIQNALLETIGAKDSPIETLCRYFAYSRMPFMTDPDRDESGIMFYRKNVFSLYKAVEELYVRFGICFDLPPLFAMGIDEGDYGRHEGAEPDLNNLCPNCTNHRDNMDTHNKPQSVVYDIAEVGYSVDGKQVKKTEVITF